MKFFQSKLFFSFVILKFGGSHLDDSNESALWAMNLFFFPSHTQSFENVLTVPTDMTLNYKDRPGSHIHFTSYL